LGRARGCCAECNVFSKRCSFAARKQSDSDTGRTTADRNAIDRAAADCFASSDGDRDATPDCISKSNANSNPHATSQPFTDIDANRDRNSASQSDADANTNSNCNTNSASEPIANGNIDTADRAKRDAVVIFTSNTAGVRQPRFANAGSARAIAAA
jgi:hypothetical protein